jgi:hypothetical protein
MDESALILSKADSVKQDKRARDAFDIYFLLFGPQGQHIADQLKHLSASFPQVSLQLERLHRFLVEHPEKFDKNVLSYCRENPRVAKPSEYVRTLLFS